MIAPPSAGSPLLDVRGVTLQYKTKDHLVTATYRVDFQVFRSDRYILLGPSGCGKSTLLKAAGGYMTPVEGEIRLKGEIVTRPPRFGTSCHMRWLDFDKSMGFTRKKLATYSTLPFAFRGDSLMSVMIVL